MQIVSCPYFSESSSKFDAILAHLRKVKKVLLQRHIGRLHTCKSYITRWSNLHGTPVLYTDYSWRPIGPGSNHTPHSPLFPRKDKIHLTDALVYYSTTNAQTTDCDRDVRCCIRLTKMTGFARSYSQHPFTGLRKSKLLSSSSNFRHSNHPFHPLMMPSTPITIDSFYNLFRIENRHFSYPLRFRIDAAHPMVVYFFFT